MGKRIHWPPLVLGLLAAATLFCYVCTLRQAALRQSVALFSLLAEENAPARAVNRFFADPADGEAYEAGLRVLAETGYGEVYPALLAEPYLLPTGCFAAAAAALFLLFLLQRQILLRRQRREAETAADFFGGPGDEEPVFRDLPAVLVTAMREMKRKLRRQQALHEEDNRKIMRYMEDISHQLKTPLTVIRVVCERTALRSPETESAMDTCLSQVDRIKDMIWKLLTLGRFDCGKARMRFAPTPVSELLEAATGGLQEIADKKGLRFSVETDGPDTWICDGFWMEEALGNVLKNCLEHTDQGVISIRCGFDNGIHKIVIRDHGDGIAQGCEAKLFDRYFFGDRTSRESNGLGLAIAAQVIRLHFGTITGKNCPDGGAEFVLTFPRLDRRIYEKTGEAPFPVTLL